MDNKDLGATRKSGQPAVIASATEPASRLRPTGFRQAQGASLNLNAELARVAAYFQLRSICLHMGFQPPSMGDGNG